MIPNSILMLIHQCSCCYFHFNQREPNSLYLRPGAFVVQVCLCIVVLERLLKVVLDVLMKLLDYAEEYSVRLAISSSAAMVRKIQRWLKPL